MKRSRSCGNIILVIDEVHNLVGAGDAEGSMNAANILKPALSRGEIQVIGATTFNEYRKYIEKDSALERRFQPVTVNEPYHRARPSPSSRGIGHYYERSTASSISPEIARQAVMLSERYITDRFLPDKAIDLLDEACSDLNLHSKNIGRLEELQRSTPTTTWNLDAQRRTPNRRRTIMSVWPNCAAASAAGRRDRTNWRSTSPALTMENLARIIELWTKIPASKIRAQEYEQLTSLDDTAQEAHRRAGRGRRLPLPPPSAATASAFAVKKHPVSFIFVGSTGVGKTELVKLPRQRAV